MASDYNKSHEKQPQNPKKSGKSEEPKSFIKPGVAIESDDLKQKLNLESRDALLQEIRPYERVPNNPVSNGLAPGKSPKEPLLGGRTFKWLEELLSHSLSPVFGSLSNPNPHYEDVGSNLHSVVPSEKYTEKGIMPARK